MFGREFTKCTVIYNVYIYIYDSSQPYICRAQAHKRGSGIQAGLRHTSREQAHKRGSGTRRIQAYKRGLGTQAGCRHKSGGQAQSKRKQIANSGTQAGFRRKQSASRLPTQAHKQGSGAIRARAIANADRAQHSGAIRA